MIVDSKSRVYAKYTLQNKDFYTHTINSTELKPQFSAKCLVPMSDFAYPKENKAI